MADISNRAEAAIRWRPGPLSCEDKETEYASSFEQTAGRKQLCGQNLVAHNPAMTTTRHDQLPFLLFQVKGGLFAVGCEILREIVVMPPVTGIPNVPGEVRGVINLRGKVIRTIDLRVKLGLPPLRAELDALIQLLRDREQDHRNWLAELEACVRERRPFGMARDPHKCKFGLWYDQFKTKDGLLGMTLPGMDAPHKIIHATADEALRRAESGDPDGALEVINARRNHELAALIRLFEEARRILVEKTREVAVVVCRGEDRLAFSADLVEAVERIPDKDIEPMPAALEGPNGNLGCRLGKRLKTNQTVLILGEEFFFPAAAVN